MLTSTPNSINKINPSKDRKRLNTKKKLLSPIKSLSPSKQRPTCSSNKNNNNTPLSSSSSSSKEQRQNVLSPLQQKMEQESIEARALRLTPELPQLQNLTLDCNNINNHHHRDQKVESGVGGNDDSEQNEYENDNHNHSGGGVDSERSIRTMNSMNSSISSNSLRRRESEGSGLASMAIHRSPSHRRLRVRTLEADAHHQQHHFLVSDVMASTERVKRNTDSMLEDVTIANKLKRRLGSRRESTGTNYNFYHGHCRKTIESTGLSDFIMKCIMEESLDAMSIARPTNYQLSHAADLAMAVCLEGYFENMQDLEVETKNKARQIFMESLIREEYNQGDYICHQNDVGDKLFIVEEGMVQFLIGNQVAGLVQKGNIFGELSLVYGIPRAADAKALTPYVMIWSLDALSFRRIQALVAHESLKASTLQMKRSATIKKFRKEYSSLSDLQEVSYEKQSVNIEFKSLKRNAIIGKGTFGSVYLVSVRDQEKRRDKYYAMKCMSKASVVERGNQKRVLIERNILQELQSSFIISLLGTYQDESCIYFLTDFVQGGNLMSYMIQKDILSHSECLFFSANIVLALIHIHDMGFVHRDLKPENCLIEKNGYLKLCDFGMAKRLPSTVQLPNGGAEVVSLAFTMCGTPEFMAPEFVLSTGYDKGVDIWALGCIVVEMYTGRSPFVFDGNLKETFKEVCLIGMGRKKFTPSDILDKQGFEMANDFTSRLLSTFKSRLGKEDTSELKSHGYFQEGGINFDQLQRRQITAPYSPKISHASDVSHFKKDAEKTSKEEIKPFEGDDDWCEDF